MIDRDKIKELSNGKIFKVIFTKRTTGEERTMLARFSVTSRLHGGSRAYDPGSKDLIYVFDMNRVAYRAFPADGVKEIKIRGKVYHDGDREVSKGDS